MYRGTPRSSHGMSLIEILVAVIVLSIGLLGIAALQIQSKRSNFEAIQRTTATMLTHEIVERMRNNASRLEDYLTTVGGGVITAAPTPNCSNTNPCTPQQLVQRDLWEWERAIDGAEEVAGGSETGGLVMPTGCITGPAGGGSGIYTVSLAWRGQNSIQDANPSGCGQGSGKYDDSPGDNVYRRVLAINVFVDAG